MKPKACLYEGQPQEASVVGHVLFCDCRGCCEAVGDLRREFAAVLPHRHAVHLLFRRARTRAAFTVAKAHPDEFQAATHAAMRAFWKTRKRTRKQRRSAGCHTQLVEVAS